MGQIGAHTPGMGMGCQDRIRLPLECLQSNTKCLQEQAQLQAGQTNRKVHTTIHRAGNIHGFECREGVDGEHGKQ